LASSGVEKVIKLWSPLDISKDLKNVEMLERKIHQREDYYWMVTSSHELLDCGTESTNENPQMIAFFDSLVQREISSSSSSSSTENENEDNDENTTETVVSDAAVQNSGNNSETPNEVFRDHIDSLIARKRLTTRTGSQDSDYVRNVIQNAKETLRSSSADECSDIENTMPTELTLEPAEVCENIQSEILNALETELTATEEIPGTSNDSQETPRVVFKKGKGSKRSYRRPNDDGENS
jgi:hypothetical protein